MGQIRGVIPYIPQLRSLMLDLSGLIQRGLTCPEIIAQTSYHLWMSIALTPSIHVWYIYLYVP